MHLAALPQPCGLWEPRTDHNISTREEKKERGKKKKKKRWTGGPPNTFCRIIGDLRWKPFSNLFHRFASRIIRTIIILPQYLVRPETSGSAEPWLRQGKLFRKVQDIQCDALQVKVSGFGWVCQISCIQPCQLIIYYSLLNMNYRTRTSLP